MIYRTRRGRRRHHLPKGRRGRSLYSSVIDSHPQWWSTGVDRHPAGEGGGPSTTPSTPRSRRLQGHRPRRSGEEWRSEKEKRAKKRRKEVVGAARSAWGCVEGHREAWRGAVRAKENIKREDISILTHRHLVAEGDRSSTTESHRHLAAEGGRPSTTPSTPQSECEIDNTAPGLHLWYLDQSVVL